MKEDEKSLNVCLCLARKKKKGERESCNAFEKKVSLQEGNKKGNGGRAYPGCRDTRKKVC